MKRCFSFCLLLIFLFGGCSSGQEDNPDVSGSSADSDNPILTSREIELLVWVEPGGEADFITAAADKFTKKYPNIHIRTESFDSPEIIRRAQSTASSSGGADLFVLPHMEVRALAEASLILPARDQSKIKDAVFPACAQAAMVNGTIYGYPVSSETTALFYNKRFISEEELPSTWEEVISFNKSYKDGDRLGFIMPVGSPYAVATFISEKNNRPFGAEGEDAGEYNLLTSEALEGMEVFKKLKGALSSEELSDSAVETMFAQERAVLCVGGPWNVARFSGEGIDFGVAPLPAFAEDEPSASLAFAQVMAVSAYSESPDEASAFADMLLTEEMQRMRVEMTGELPSIAIDLSTPSYAAGFSAQMQNAFAATSIPSAEGFWDSFGEAAARIWDGGSIQTVLSEFTSERTEE